MKVILLIGTALVGPSARALGSAANAITRAIAAAAVGLLLFLSGCSCFGPICQSNEMIWPPCPDGFVRAGEVCRERRDNYHACTCSCPSAFDRGAHVQTPAVAFPALSAGGALVGGEQLAGSGGTIIGGPRTALGSPEPWWQVDFDADPDGWLPQGEIAVVDILATKTVLLCLPPELNPNRSGSHVPTEQELEDDCGVRAATRANQVLGAELPQPCSCTQFVDAPSPTGAAPPARNRRWSADCDAPCGDSSGVCVVAGSDPPEPTPDPLSAAVFTTTSTCDVRGTVMIDVDGREPETQPGARSIVQIHGRRCPPGATCQVGMSYQLGVDDITFDSGSIFADDPKVVELSISGASTPDGITLGTFLGGCCLGPLARDSALSSVRGRRSDSSEALVAVFKNSLAVAGVIVDWAHKKCALAGPLSSFPVDNGDNGEGTVNIEVSLTGDLVNQPPAPDTSRTSTRVECTSAQGAAVRLDASASTDPDGNIISYGWRRDSNTGAAIVPPSNNPVVTTQQALGQKTYALRVVDGYLAADSRTVDVSVVDTTGAAISCNAPATMKPSDVVDKKTGLSFRATATDTCSGVSQVVVTSFGCTKPQECRVQLAGDTITILDSGGIGDVISWTVAARDAAGNGALKTCQLTVVKK